VRALATEQLSRAWLFTKKEKQGSGRKIFCKKNRSKTNFASTWYTIGGEAAYASSLLVHPKATPFGTGHRIKKLKTCRRQLFLTLFALTGFEPPFDVKNRYTRKKVIATARRREGACNRTVEPSVAFYEKGEAR